MLLDSIKLGTIKGKPLARPPSVTHITLLLPSRGASHGTFVVSLVQGHTKCRSSRCTLGCRVVNQFHLAPLIAGHGWVQPDCHFGLLKIINLVMHYAKFNTDISVYVTKSLQNSTLIILCMWPRASHYSVTFRWAIRYILDGLGYTWAGIYEWILNIKGAWLISAYCRKFILFCIPFIIKSAGSNCKRSDLQPAIVLARIYLPHRSRA